MMIRQYTDKRFPFAILILLAPLVVPGLAYSALPHPRIFLTPSVLQRLRENRDADWQELKDQADRYLRSAVAPYQRTGCPSNSICYAYQGQGWQSAIQILGVAYQVTGNAAYANQVIAIMDAANAPYKNTGSIEPLSLDSGYPTRSAALGLALAFDWVYDRLDNARKADTVNTLNAWFDWYKQTNRGDAKTFFYGNYFGGDILGFGAVGYATEDDNPRAVEIQSYVRQVFDRNVPAAFTSGGFAGGYAVESYGYGPYTFRYLLQYMQLAEDNTNHDLGLTTYAKQMARALLYNLKPNRWQATDEGDYPSGTTGVLAGFFPLILASVLEGTTEGKWMQWLYDHLETPPQSGVSIQRPDVFVRFLYGNRARPGLDYRTEAPTVYRSRGDEHVYFRSNWTDNAVWASFAAGGAWWTDHEAKKAGHIAIQRGDDYLLVNSGQWKGPTGVAGNPQAFDKASWRANTLFFDDHGEYMYGGPRYVGGQGYWGNNAVLASDHGDGYFYSKADLTMAYDKRPGGERRPTRPLQSFLRSFIALGDRFFVVWDRVTAFNPSYDKKLFWHVNPTGGAPLLNGTVAQSTVGDSALFIKTLLPAAPTIRVTTDGVSSFADPNPITYRVEVSNSESGTTLNALHVLEATARGQAFSGASTIQVSSGNMVGALIADRTARAVLFSTDGAPQASVTYQADYAGSGRHVIVDLVPGAYNVAKDGAGVLSMHSTSTAGVLSFEAAGGRFVISKQDQAGGSIAKVSGDLQVGPTGMNLPEPLVVKVTGANGSPLSNIDVEFSVRNGGTILSSSSVSTDEDGLAAVTIGFQSIPGPVTVEASNLGITQNSATFTLAAVDPETGSGNPRISSIVNGGSFWNQALAGGSIVSLFGSNLASEIAVAQTIPLPTTLEGVSVQTNGISAPLFYVSPFQLNFQLPWELSTLPEATITVVADGAVSQPRRIPIAPHTPGVFSLGATSDWQGAIFVAQSGEIAAPTGSVSGIAARPAARGEIVSIYCTGLGSVFNAPPAGMVAGDNPLSRTTATPSVLFGGVPAQVTRGFFSGLAPNYLGLYQVNVQIPLDAPAGDAVPVVLDVNGSTSNAVTIALQ